MFLFLLPGLPSQGTTWRMDSKFMLTIIQTHGIGIFTQNRYVMNQVHHNNQRNFRLGKKILRFLDLSKYSHKGWIYMLFRCPETPTELIMVDHQGPAVGWLKQRQGILTLAHSKWNGSLVFFTGNCGGNDHPEVLQSSNSKKVPPFNGGVLFMVMNWWDPNSRVFYTHYKDLLSKVGWPSLI